MVSQNCPARVCALGFFDGLHRGHMALMRAAAVRAAGKNAVFTVITFSEHPQSVITGSRVRLLSTNESRADMLKRLGGAEEVIFLPFDEALMHLPWQDFIKNTLIARYRAVGIVAGENFRFGYLGSGNSENMPRLCRDLGVGCDIVESVSDVKGPISSSRIRVLVADGKMEEAAALLGHPHEIAGIVSHGRGVGSKLGIPTLNIPFPPSLVLPPLGVYAGRARLSGRRYDAVFNIGRRPTFPDAGDGVVIEAHLLRFDGDAYGIPATAEIYKFLRAERAFSSQSDLKEAIARDLSAAEIYMADQV